jgi:hypothetical protein
MTTPNLPRQTRGDRPVPLLAYGKPGSRLSAAVRAAGLIPAPRTSPEGDGRC